MGIRRNSYVHGSAAEKIDYDVYSQNRVLKEKKQFKSNAGIKARMLVVVMIVFFMGLFVMYRYTTITELNFRISKLQNDYSRIVNENRSLRVAIEKETNLSKISLAASEKLGMQMPDKYQINYIRVPKTNYTVAGVIYEDTEQNEGFFTRLAKLEILESIKR